MWGVLKCCPTNRVKDEKAKLQQALNQVNAGSSASEAQITDMTDTIESLR